MTRECSETEEIGVLKSWPRTIDDTTRRPQSHAVTFVEPLDPRRYEQVIALNCDGAPRGMVWRVVMEMRDGVVS